MKIKFIAKDCSHKEWCDKHFVFYTQLINKSYYNISTKKLIQRYYENHGVMLDESFVIGMLESLPDSCAKRLPNGCWDFFTSGIFVVTKSK